MYAAYLFSVVLGGGLLLLSLLGNLLGGDASDLELDVDIDLDVEMDIAGEVEAHHDAASKILSLRTLTYVVFGFGAVGWLLSWMGLAPAAPMTMTYAAAGGMTSGVIAHMAFAYLRRTETGQMVADDSFVGLAADVTLPVAEGSPGHIAVLRGDRRFTLRALPHTSAVTSAPVETWKKVVVVEMTDGVARVAPIDQDLNLLT